MDRRHATAIDTPSLPRTEETAPSGLEAVPPHPSPGRGGRDGESAWRDGLQRTYARMAPLYDVVFGRILEPGRREMAAVASELRPHDLLEVGVGSGLTLARYPQETRVVGIDLSEEMLVRARRQALRLAGRRIELMSMNAEQMDFPDASFDCVTVPYVMSVTSNVDRLVREIRRVCRPDGTILILNHFSGSRFWGFFEEIGRPLARRAGFDPDFDYRQHVLAHDWNVVSTRPVNLMGLSKLVVVRNRRAAPPRPVLVSASRRPSPTSSD